MTDSELLQAIEKIMDKRMQPMEKSIAGLQADVGSLKADVGSLKTDVGSLKTDVGSLKADVGELKTDMQVVKQRVTSLELTLENETNHNIQLLAENHMNLIDKLNQAIRVSDKTLLYEVQVSSLKSKVEHLEKEVADIKNKIA